jgi:hypothetical protein
VKFFEEDERSVFNWGDLRLPNLPNLPNEISVALISSGLNLCCPYFIGAVIFFLSAFSSYCFELLFLSALSFQL